VSNPERDQVFTGQRLSVKNPGFNFVNKSYEQFRDEMFKQEKSGTPWRDQEGNVRQMYDEGVNREKYLMKQGYDGYPSPEDELFYDGIQNMRPVDIDMARNSKLVFTARTISPVTKFVSGTVPHYYEWNTTENPSGYNWCGHAALKSVAKYHGSLKNLSQIHTAFSNNSSAYVNGGKGRCNDYKYCAGMSDLLWMANNQNNKTWNYNFPSTGTATRSTIASFFQQLRDGVDYNKPTIVASDYLEPYGHFYPVVGYKIVYTSNGSIDYNLSQVYLRNVQRSAPIFITYDDWTSVQNFFNQRRSNDLLIVRP
jgi:hypothetical protein